MIGSRFRKKTPVRLEALERVQAWTRERFRLAAEVLISVAELECLLPGCPPLETVVSFWDLDAKRYHFKVFKKLEDVCEGDLPYAWMKDAIQVPQGWECDCC